MWRVSNNWLNTEIFKKCLTTRMYRGGGMAGSCPPPSIQMLDRTMYCFLGGL